MDIHPFTNHDIARARAVERVQRASRDARRSVEADQKSSVEPRLRFFRRIRRRRAPAATQPHAI
jgi:hypothetical protein